MSPREWHIEFYRDQRGRAPVEDFIKSLDRQTIAKTQRSIELLEEYGDRLAMPMARRLVGYRFSELRIQTGGNNIRVFYFFRTGRRIILLHAFLKKDQQTPRRELDTAYRRLAEVIGETDE